MTTASSGVTTTGGGAGTDPLAGTRSGASSTLSPWSAGFVTNFLSKAQALGEEDYQVYGGPLTVGSLSCKQKRSKGLGI